MQQHTSTRKDTNTQVEPQVQRHLYHFAREYWDRGWPVIPLHGKRPALPTWKEFQSRRPTLNEIREWFADPKCDLNIGIVLGRVSGLVAVDCDSTTDAQWWLKDHPASPLMVETSRGLHIYYRLPNTHLGNRAKLFGRAIDLKAEASYVCAPPSRHDSGTVYTWTSPNCLDSMALDNVPQLDSAWLGTQKDHIAPVAHTPTQQHPLDELTTASIGRLQESDEVRRIVAQLRAPVADRSRRDYKVLCQLLRRGVPLDTIRELVRDHSKFAELGQRYLELSMERARRDVGGD